MYVLIAKMTGVSALGARSGSACTSELGGARAHFSVETAIRYEALACIERQVSLVIGDGAAGQNLFDDLRRKIGERGKAQQFHGRRCVQLAAADPLAKPAKKECSKLGRTARVHRRS